MAYHNDPLFQWFRQVDRDGSGQIDCGELQQALTYSGLNGNWKPFSAETCRLMMQMIDTDRSGQLNFEEYRNLWNILNGWKQVFLQADADRSGFIDQQEFERCIAQMGYRVSQHTLTAMMNRYSDNKSRQLSFDDFTACVVRLRALTDSFMSLDHQRTGVVQMHYDQFLFFAMQY